MRLIRRTVSNDAEQVQVQEERQTRPVRRVLNNAASRFHAANAAREQITEQLKLISQAEHEIDKAQAIITEATAKINELMRQNNLQMHSNGVHSAVIEETFTRQSTHIDPKKFRAAVSADVFWDCIEVAVGKAREHMTSRELDKISDVVPAKSTGYRLKIKRLEVKRRK